MALRFMTSTLIFMQLHDDNVFERLFPPLAVKVVSRIKQTLPSPDPTINSSGLISSIQRAPTKLIEASELKF